MFELFKGYREKYIECMECNGKIDKLQENYIKSPSNFLLGRLKKAEEKKKRHCGDKCNECECNKYKCSDYHYITEELKRERKL